MITFKQFEESGVRPSLELIDTTKISYKSYSDMLLLTESEALDPDFIPVCDRMVWLASSVDPRGKKSYFSCDGEYIYMYSGKRDKILSYIISPDGKFNPVAITPLKWKSSSESVTNNKQNKEEDTPIMDGNTNLQDLMNQVASEAAKASTGPAAMTAFDGGVGAENASESDDKKALKKQQNAALAETHKKLRADAKHELAGEDTSRLVDCWNSSASLIAWITPTEARQTITASKVSQKPADRQLIAAAPESVRAAFSKSPASVDAEYIQKVYKIEAKEGKPGKMVGAFVQIPSFLKGRTVQEFTQKVVTDGPQSEADKATVIEMLRIDDLEQKMGLVSGKIKEDPRTHGVSGEIKLDIYISKSQASQANGLTVNGGTKFSKKFSRTGSGANKTVLMDGNYFPIVTYETYDIYGQLTPEQVVDLNNSCFTNLFAKGKTTLSKIRLLPAEQQANFSQAEDGNITSNYITSDVAKRITLEVKSFFDKDLTRDTIRVPMKRAKDKADGSKSSLQFVKYNAASEADMQDPAYFAKTSLGNGKYQDIIDIVGSDILTPKNLKETFKRGGTGTGAASKVIDHLVARAVFLAKIRGSQNFDNVSISGLNFGEE